MSYKKMIVRGRAAYRGMEVMETATGFVVVVRSKTYEFETFSEATAFIDAVYIEAGRSVMSGTMRTQ